MTNAAVYLPEITQKQISAIQIAANHAIRACANVRIKDKVNMNSLRQELRIPSIEVLKKRTVDFQAWKSREKLSKENLALSKRTRAAIKGYVRPKNRKDWLRLAYNHLNPTLTSIRCPKTAKRIIKRTYQESFKIAQKLAI